MKRSDHNRISIAKASLTQPLLQTNQLTKRYGRVTVLDEVKFDVRAGEVHALLGANGAGKSTLCKILAGLTAASGGSMTLDGRNFAPTNKQIAEAAGVQIVQQELNLIATLSVAENISLGRLPKRFGVIRRGELNRRARAALDRFELHDVPVNTLAGKLGIGRQQLVEIATALDRECRLLILDEPTAALTSQESAQLFGWINVLRRQSVGMIYISHRLDEVVQIADRITVLRDGKRVGTYSPAAVNTDDLVELMSGDQTGSADRHEHQSLATPDVVLRVHELGRGRAFQDVSFAVHAGERFGIAGLVGAGRTELLRAIFGADIAESGTVQCGHAAPVRFQHPRDAVRAGLAMVTEDRKANGLLLSQSIRTNTTLNSLVNRFAQLGVIRHQLERRIAEQMCQRLSTRCTSVEQSVGTLSGGNQQKVVISRWLVRGADLFLFDEPTRGIDVSARQQIYQLFAELAAQGKGIVIVSSDIEELLETCDRIAVMSAGRLVETFSRSGDGWSHERLMQAAFAGQLCRQPA